MKPTICKCCGEEFTSEPSADSQNPNICRACASLLDDVQDDMIIETAIPWEREEKEEREVKAEELIDEEESSLKKRP